MNAMIWGLRPYLIGVTFKLRTVSASAWQSQIRLSPELNQADVPLSRREGQATTYSGEVLN